MAVTICAKGHFYDNQKFFRCPYCGISLEVVKKENIYKDAWDDEKTVKLQDSSLEDDKTVICLEETDTDKGF